MSDRLHLRAPRWLASLLLVLLVGSGSVAVAQDLSLAGCDTLVPGEVGIPVVTGDIGDTVAVAVRISTVNGIDTFGLEVIYPTSLLTYDRTERGDLTTAFTALDGNEHSPGRVRVGAWDTGTFIPSGVEGELAVLYFAIDAAGSDAFGMPTDELKDDIAGYTPCPEVTISVRATSFGRVKSEYR